MNYKNDDSFFTTVLPPFVCFGWSVKSWLLDDDAAKFRYIRDYEIESEFSGKIVKILVDDSSPVEFDQPLFLLDPS